MNTSTKLASKKLVSTKFINFTTKYHKYIVFISMIITLTGIGLNIYAATLNRNIIREEKNTHNDGNVTNEEFEKILNKRIRTTDIGHIGVILLGIGFIINIIQQLIFYFYNGKKFI